VVLPAGCFRDLSEQRSSLRRPPVRAAFWPVLTRRLAGCLVKWSERDALTLPPRHYAPRSPTAVAEEIAGSPGTEAMKPQFTIQAVSASATPAAEAARRRSSSSVASGKPSRIASSR
jgi:hypothetical protein